MRILWIILFPAFLPAAALGGDSSFTNPGDRGFPADYQEVDTHPKKTEAIRRYADDAQSGAQENLGVQPVHDNEVFAVFRADRLEYQTGEGNDLLLWDAQAWVGTDYNKLWFKSEGTWLTDQEEFEEAVIELFYSRNIASYWDAQIGIRHDFKPIPTGLSPHLAFKGLCRYGSKWRRPHMSARTVIFLRLWRPNIICSSAGG